jgi:G:T-mismatch repair DNA endonuclease (very short patch repair protein)
MSRIRSTNASIDLKMKKILSEHKIKFAMYSNMSDHAGYKKRPDFYIKKIKIKLF